MEYDSKNLLLPRANFLINSLKINCFLDFYSALPFLLRQRKKKDLSEFLLVSHLARALSFVVALADAVPAVRRAGQAAAARTASRIAVVALGASLAPEAVVADPARALTLMIALGPRGAQGAGARLASDARHQVPRTRSASVAVLAVGQVRTHAATGVGVAHMTRSHTRVAHCGTTVGYHIRFSSYPFSSSFGTL